MLDTLAAEHRVGLFAEPRTYAAWIRFANAGSKTDREKDVRGMAIKVFDVPGANLTPGETSQDFVLNSHPVMVAPNTREFLQAMKALEAGGFQQARYFLTHPRAALIGLRARQQPACHLDIPYWSTTPYLFGPGRAVKYHVRPASGAVSSVPSNLTDTYLTDALKKRLSQEDAFFELTVQFQTNPGTMPIEDASVEWSERESPYVPLARIRIPKQAIDQADTASRCESHRLQSVARASRPSAARQHEPGPKGDLPGDGRFPRPARRHGHALTTECLHALAETPGAATPSKPTHEPGVHREASDSRKAAISSPLRTSSMSRTSTG